MRKNDVIYCICILIISCAVISCRNVDKSKTYFVNYVNEIDIDNLLSDETWSEANMISDFCMPWDTAPAQETLLRALFDDEYIYIKFNTLESDLVLLDSVSAELDLAEEDRVEVYFSYSEALDEYYCFEVDPYGRVLDYMAKFYRKFDEEWDLDQIIVDSEISENGYVVAMAFPLKALESIKIDLSKPFYVGLYRADFKHTKDGLKPDWVSWINPGTTKEDFHIPETFGFFSLTK